jgi:hypothetical protein
MVPSNQNVTGRVSEIITTPRRGQPGRLCKSKQQAQEPLSSHTTAKSSMNKSLGKQTRALRNQNKTATAKMTEEGCHHPEDAVQSTNSVATPSASSSKSHAHPRTTAVARLSTQKHNKRIIPNPSISPERKRHKPHRITELPEGSEDEDADGETRMNRIQELALESRSTTDPESQGDIVVPKGLHSLPNGGKDVESEGNERLLASNYAVLLTISQAESSRRRRWPFTNNRTDVEER